MGGVERIGGWEMETAVLEQHKKYFVNSYYQQFAYVDSLLSGPHVGKAQQKNMLLPFFFSKDNPIILITRLIFKYKIIHF